jgi:UDP:flavonoid glycosyltransferase YjiC (YdhE family)
VRIIVLTVGSRGDIQPYVALALGLKAAGHQVCFATEARYQPFVMQQGLEFALLPGDSQARHADPAWQRHVCATQPNLARSLKQCARRFILPHLRSQLEATWKICQGYDAIVSSPSVYGSCHVAYQIGVPFYTVWTSPATPTRAFPHSWSRLPDQRWLGGWLNRWSVDYVNRLFWQVLGPTINQWRQTQLGLPPFGSDATELRSLPNATLYAYSPTFLPKPDDWSDRVHVTGYWFLDQDFDSATATDLQQFLQAGRPPLYVGFGSVMDCTEVIKIAIAAVVKTKQRAVIEANWAELDRVELPPSIYRLAAGEVPHAWLFPQMAALIHHGGAGTVGEGLRAGKPMIVIYQKSTDYYFWGQQVAKQGLGSQPIQRDRVTMERLAQAIEFVLSDPVRDRAQQLGQQIRAEAGVQTAVETLQQHFPSDSPSLVLSS